MIPVLTAEQLRQADAHTIDTGTMASIDLMERAASGCAEKLLRGLEHDRPVVVLAGMGNNGGDGLAIARMMHAAGQPLRVFVLRYKENGSTDFQHNLARAQEAGVPVVFLEEGDELPGFDLGSLVIDAVLGTGIQRPMVGWLKGVVVSLNGRDNTVVAIDLPSGLFSEDNTGNDPDAILQADRTYTLEVPKLALFLPENERFVGDWEVVPIGLDRGFIGSLKPAAQWLEQADVAAMMPIRKHFGHKGDFGHAWLFAGAEGKMGAALLATKACLRTGTGLVTVHVPKGQEGVVHAFTPEAMVSMDEDAAQLASLPIMAKVSAIGIGPGIGTSDATARMLKLLIQNAPAPFVIDADALNILAENKTWSAFLPAGTILTPHPKEFERLAGKATSDHERLMMAKEMAMKLKAVLVLKGAFTAICSPDGRIFFNSTGNPGMAKGGSGDALTGVITGLRAQGLDPLSAALLGVYAHGSAGDIAAEESGMDGMLPGDLVERLPLAWKKLRGG